MKTDKLHLEGLLPLIHELPEEQLPATLAQLASAQGMVAARLVEAARRGPDPAGPPPEPLLDAGEAAALLSIPESRVRSLAREGELPVHRIGKYVRFRRSELEAWLAKKNRPQRLG